MSNASAHPAVSATLRGLADLLTASRVLVAFVLLAGGPTPMTALVLVAWAWASDAADGPLARASGGAGRLGAHDHLVDAAVGVAMIWYLGGLGVVPVLPSRLLALGLVALWAITRVMAAQMLLQTIAGAAFMWWTVTTDAAASWVLPALALGLLGLEWRRVTTELVPAFLGGWRDLVTGRFGRTGPR